MTAQQIARIIAFYRHVPLASFMGFPLCLQPDQSEPDQRQQQRKREEEATVAIHRASPLLSRSTAAALAGAKAREKR